MFDYTPHVRTLAQRLRQLADELESADRYGVPVPLSWSIDGHEFGDVGFHLTAEEFAAWADYTEATVEEYDHDGKHWQRVEVDVNGLPMRFATSTPILEAVS